MIVIGDLIIPPKSWLEDVCTIHLQITPASNLKLILHLHWNLSTLLQCRQYTKQKCVSSTPLAPDQLVHSVCSSYPERAAATLRGPFGEARLGHSDCRYQLQLEDLWVGSLLINAVNNLGSGCFCLPQLNGRSISLWGPGLTLIPKSSL